ncbi:class I SAM-dependent methyltransferase [uncultured Thiothrix sp.]|uniref:class I SAM-dependent methyltransferase n=1 Tax=uncultured Thiothrix sp. TaxID=223185 RepID=UPI0026214610|nr:class I SAM-dependent methyltransferase [uncultured Thiothrix sp.]
MKNQKTEVDLVFERYSKRNVGNRYNILNADVWKSTYERNQSILKILARYCDTNLAQKTLLEVGCGNGRNLLDCLRFGFTPSLLTGIELLPEQVNIAKNILPSSVNIYKGDALSIQIPINSQDIVFQSVVFSSLLDNNFQSALAIKMWQWLKPGGGILWYDFIFNNPSNPDVRGVPLKRVRELFPDGKLIVKRVTLAPPISRRVCKIHPNLYHLFNMIPWLRTHVLIWIEKPKVSVP